MPRDHHTPGPWLAKQRHSGIGTDLGWVILHPTKGGTHMKRLDNAGDFTKSDAYVLAASTRLLEAAQAAWNCIAELSPTQARVEVAQLLQAAIEAAVGDADA